MTKVITESNTHTSGTIIGATANEAIGFHGFASTQGTAMTDLVAATDASAMMATVNSVLDVLRDKGIIASS
jgi:hypothetical protein